MRVRSQLILAAAAATVLTALLAAGLIHATHKSNGRVLERSDAQEVARDIGNLLTLTNEFAFYASERAAVQWHLRHAQLVATVNQALQRQNPPPPTLLDMRRSISDLASLFDALVQLAREPAAPLMPRRKELLIERLLAETQAVVEARHRWAVAISAEEATDRRVFTSLVLATPILLLLMLLGLGAMIGGRVLAPLARLQAAVTAMRGGDLTVRFVSAAQDELGDAARAVDAMASSLQLQSTAQRASENHLRLVLDNVPAMIGYIDLDRRLRSVNRAYAQWHGRAPEDILGRLVSDSLGPATFALVEPHLEQAFAGRSASVDLQLLRDGSQRMLNLNYVPQVDDRGQTVGVYSMLIDVTQLKRSQQQLRTVMDSSPLGMFVASAQGLCEYVNPQWQRIAGMSLAQARGSGWRRSTHPGDRRRLLDAWNAAVTRGHVAGVSEHRMRRPDGTVVWVRGHIAQMHAGDRSGRLVGTIEDITERRQLDAALVARTDELARSNAELEQFAYVASHDLQEPLRMVTSYTQLLLRRHGDKLDGDAREFLDFIDDGGRRAQALISDLLNLAKVNSMAKPFEPVAVEAVLADVLRGLKLLVTDSGATITHDTPLPVVSADRRQLGQVLQNLLANALKFAGGEAPRVHVGATREADGRWRISVADNGIGIEPRFHERVFVLFQRLHLRSEYAGTGIGLAICKKVIQRHGGRIGVESAAGKGSTFWFTLADVATADPDVPNEPLPDHVNELPI